MLLIELAWRQLWAARWPALLQVAAIAVGFAVASSVFTLRQTLSTPDVPGARCAGAAGLLTKVEAGDARRDTFSPSEIAALETAARGSDLVAMAGTVATLQFADSRREQSIVLVGDGFFEHLCIEPEQGNVPAPAARPTALIHADLLSELPALGPGTHVQLGALDVEVTGVTSAFQGLRPHERPDRLFVPLRWAPELGLDIDALDQPLLRVLLIPHPGVSADAALKEIDVARQRDPTRFAGVRGFERVGNFSLSGTNAATAEVYAKLLGGLAAVLLGLVVLSMALYYAGRSEEHRSIASLLSALGADRRRLLLLAALEPLVLIVLGAVCARWIERLVTDAVGVALQGDSFSLEAVRFAEASWVGSLTLAAVLLALVTTSRYVAVRRQTRPNRLQAQRQAAMKLPLLLLAQVFFATVVVSLAAQAAWGYWRSLPPAPAYDPNGIRQLLLVGPERREGPDFATAWAAAVRDGLVPPGIELAWARSLLPVRSFAFEPAQARTPNQTIPVQMNRVSPEFFALLRLRVEGPGLHPHDALDPASGEATTVILNERAAQQLWPEGARGGMVQYQPPRLTPRNAWVTARVVGFVDERTTGISDAAGDRSLKATAYVLETDATQGSLLIRGHEGLSSEELARHLEPFIGRILPGAQIRGSSDLGETYRAVIGRERTMAALLCALAAGALSVAALAALGIVLTMLRQLRTEFAVRFATGSPLGAVRVRLVGVLAPPIVLGLVVAALPAIWLGQLFTVLLPLAISPLVAFAAGVAGIAVPAALLITHHARALTPSRYLPWLRRE